MSEDAARTKRINLVQGEYQVSDDPDVVLTTLLGSCVGACIRDPARGIGGMNHFLLPGPEVGGAKESERLGVHLMELLLNGLMRRGAQRERLEAKIFGGARMMQGLSDVGKKNADFARRFLGYEGIRIVGSDLGGDRGRRLQFWPVSGRARQSYIARTAEMNPRPIAPTPEIASAGDVDLF
jgi:chemotaxis protein CheD